MDNLLLTINNLDDAIFVLPFHEGCPASFLEVSDHACSLTGYSREELLQLSAFELGVMHEVRTQAIQALTQQGNSIFEMQLVRKSGEKVAVEMFCKLLRTDTRSYVICLARDITEHKRSEQALKRLNRELHAISTCNHAMLRATNEQALLDEICLTTCRDAGYRMAWVGFVHDAEPGVIQPAAWAGFEAGYLTTTKLKWADTESARCPAELSLRLGEASCFQDIESEGLDIWWRSQALARGCRSVVGLPLKNCAGKTFGTLCIYSEDVNAFTPAELRLLGELAADLAFGISVLRSRLELQRAELERAAHLRFLDSMDKVNHAMQGSLDIEQTVVDVLDLLLSLFECDRAWVIHPCDPKADSWTATIVRSRPQYPLNTNNKTIVPVDDYARRDFSAVMASQSPVTFGPGQDLSLSPSLATGMKVQSRIATALYPKGDLPSMFGLHQCSYERRWTSEEKDLLQEVGRRLSDVLTGLLAHRNLVESEKKYRSIVNTAAEAILTVDSNDTITFSNEKLLDLLDRPLGEILGKKLTDFIPEEEHLDFRAKIARDRQGGAEPHERRLLRNDGQTVWVLVSAAPILDSDAGQTGVLAMLTNITKRKQAEEIQRRLNRELAAINACNQILLRAEDEPGLLNEICRVICETGGYSMAWVGYAEHDVPKSIRPVACAGYETGYLANVNVSWAGTDRGKGPAGTAIRTGEHQYIADTFRCPVFQSLKDVREAVRQRGYRSVVALPLKDDNGTTFGVLMIYSNEPDSISLDERRLLTGLAADLAFGISVLRLRAAKARTDEAREKLQAQFIQAQKLESIGRLAGGVAHDFNNMLTVITGNTELALIGLDDSDPLHEALLDIKTAAESSIRLTRQLLAFARKQTIAPKVLNLNDAVQGTLSILRRLIGEDIVLNWLPGTNVWPIKMDPGQLDQILANLCVNARDAIAGVGKVVIETSNMTIDEGYGERHGGIAPGDYVKLSVSDNGCGMDQATQSRVFEPFFTTKPSGVGTGLGLATVYGIVEQNGGLLDICSELGQGTTLSIRLPRHETAQEHLRRTSLTPLAVGTGTVLLVEDNEQSLKTTRLMLEYLGYEVLAATGPHEAIQLAQERSAQIHLLFTDVIMPQMNGWDLAQRVSAVNPSIRTLFTSGYAATTVTDQDVTNSHAPFIQKPFSIRGLATKIGEVLGDN